MAQALTGHYFPYCQFCTHDGRCELRHNELLGLPPGNGVDSTPYPGHENIRWHFSAFQRNSTRGQCTGRIKPSGSFFLPLVCECGTAVDSFCQKFSPNEKGKQRTKLAEQIASQKGVSVADLDPEDLPELDRGYYSVAF